MFDFSRAHGSDRDSDSDEDFGARDPEPRYGRGYGRVRDDSPYESRDEENFMPMTRRDEVDRLRDHALRDTKKFLARREEKHGALPPKSELANLAALATGLAGSAYLSQRFRQAGGRVPLGVLVGGLGYAGAHFGVFGHLGPYAKNASIGAALASLALWAAGYGSLSAERGAAQVAGTGGVAGSLGFGASPEPAGWPPPPAFAPAVPSAPPMTQADFLSFVTGGAARRAA